MIETCLCLLNPPTPNATSPTAEPTPGATVNALGVATSEYSQYIPSSIVSASFVLLAISVVVYANRLQRKRFSGYASVPDEGIEFGR